MSIAWASGVVSDYAGTRRRDETQRQTVACGAGGVYGQGFGEGERVGTAVFTWLGMGLEFEQ